MRASEVVDVAAEVALEEVGRLGLPAVPRVLTLVPLARGGVEVACKKTHLCLSAFPLFVPSLSW